MNRYQVLPSQSDIYRESTSSNVLDTIQGIFLFIFDLASTLLWRVCGPQGNINKNSLSITDEFRAGELQPSLSISGGVPSLRFDGNQKSFENHEYHPWLLVVVCLIAVGMLSYDLSKSEKKPEINVKANEFSSFQETGQAESESESESEFEFEFTSDELLSSGKLPVFLDMPKTFRKQRKEIGLPYQDLTVSRSTPTSLLLWESK